MARSDELRSLIESAGKYQISSQNNEGMNSYAFVAHHRPLDSPAFLKVYDVDPESPDLYREARALQEMGQTPNLVRVLDAERLDDESVMIAMELVSGGSLLNQLRARGRFPLMDGIKISIGILHGVAQIHSRNLVHRDLKPANIMFDDRSQCPKIGDFGSLSEIDELGFATRTSRRSALYIPPEGWGIPSKHSKGSDLYQVGLVAHELINGALPYEYDAYLDAEARRHLKKIGAGSLADVADPVERDSIVNEAIARLATRQKLLRLGPAVPYVPDPVRRVIKKATAPRAGARFAAATDFIAALEQIDCPNWFVSIDELHASAWRGADWIVAANAAGFVAYRRLGESGYRRWKSGTERSYLLDTIADL